jgi:hypothetical protein
VVGKPVEIAMKDVLTEQRTHFLPLKVIKGKRKHKHILLGRS